MVGCGAGLRPGRSLGRSPPRCRSLATRCCTKGCPSGRRRNARPRARHRPSTRPYIIRIRACVRACICALTRSSLRVARAPAPPPPSLPRQPPHPFLTLLQVRVAHRRVLYHAPPLRTKRRTPLRPAMASDWHRTPRAATRHARFPLAPPPSSEAVGQPHKSWLVSGSRALLGAPQASAGVSHSRQPTEHTAPCSHPGRLRRLPKEVSRRTKPRRSPPSPPSPRAEGPSPRVRRLCRGRRRVRSRCRATRWSGLSS